MLSKTVTICVPVTLVSFNNIKYCQHLKSSVKLIVDVFKLNTVPLFHFQYLWTRLSFSHDVAGKMHLKIANLCCIDQYRSHPNDFPPRSDLWQLHGSVGMVSLDPQRADSYYGMSPIDFLAPSRPSVWRFRSQEPVPVFWFCLEMFVLLRDWYRL